jgi:hypothetical protein
LIQLVSGSDNPNIVLILADDVSADMFSCYGQKGSAKTPNIDRIAKEGVQFKTCFAPAICAPSRALFMTGVYANRTGVFRNDMWAFDSRGKLLRIGPVGRSFYKMGDMKPRLLVSGIVEVVNRGMRMLVLMSTVYGRVRKRLSLILGSI